MRCMIYRFSGLINGTEDQNWTPHLIPFGSNIRGKRIKRGTVSIEPNELISFLNNTPATETKQKLTEFLEDLEYCYKD